ncbi:chondroitinase-B domain-containing protein [Thalassotalea sp. PS06]|uniref:chondroitinase-B domain-containing protein n=1 Tax=Thalassotalea sp. PS06 TaxID=2594005 RepID=UPI00163D9FBD|nr:chondroitinase-B domain-containing protein [Thalassotalea sp. PS06]
MKIKVLMASSAMLALTACNDSVVSDSSGNSLGTVALSGDALVGSALSASVSDGNGVDEGSISYTWMAGEMVISGASSSSYLLTEAEAGSKITVSVQYTDNDGYNEQVRSEESRTVEIPATNTAGTISISGTLESGQLITANLMDDNGFDPSNVTYSWMANGSEAIDTNASTFQLTDDEVGKTITVMATYVDNDGFDESVTSAPTAAIEPEPEVVPPQPGDIVLSGDALNGQTLSVAVTDVNGIDGDISYQWMADGMAIDGATTDEYMLTAAELGKVVTVNAMYTDGDGAAEDLTASVGDRVYSAIVKNEDELVAALGVASENDWIALASASGGDYTDMAPITIDIDGLVLTRTMSSTAEISGYTCVEIKGTGTTIDGLTFKDTIAIADSTCDGSSTSNAMVKLDGEGVIVRNSTFDGYAGTVGFNLIEIKGEDNIIERNLFTGWDSSIDKSGAISIYTDQKENEKVNTTIQYNLFKDMATESGDRKSGAYVIQVGRSTGNDATLMNHHKVQYNRFDNVEIDERLMKIQSSATTIMGNTIVNSTGMISVENGGFSTVSNNVIIPTGDDSDDGGIAFASMGHTITNNYISNVRTTSGGRGAIFIHTDKTDDTSNQTIIADNAGDPSVLISQVTANTVYNAREGINFDEKSCSGNERPSLNFTDNLIANVTGNSNAESSKGILSVKFDNSGCTVDVLTFADNHVYAKDVTDGGSIDLSTTSGALDEADLTAANDDGLVSGQGVDAGIGSDISKLHLIKENEVGPFTTWTATEE